MNSNVTFLSNNVENYYKAMFLEIF